MSIGDLAFYAIPGELYAWYGVQLKSQSRFSTPIVLGYANRLPLGSYIGDRVYVGKDFSTRPLDFQNRIFGQVDDAGERLVQAALGM